MESLVAEIPATGSHHLRLSDGQRLQNRVVPATENLNPATTGLVAGGVYLITGGSGGLGLITARFLARATAARIILTGRSPLSAEKEKTLCESVVASGGEALYLQADVTDETAMRAVVTEARRLFGPLNGVFHAAGIIRDGLFCNKRAGDFEAVIAPKIRGLTLLDKVTRDEPLSLFVLFSSVAAPLGNPGQSDYAAANSYMDRYAEWRQASPVRSGCRWLSLGWPLWRDGGMRVDEAILTRFVARTGLVPLATETGLTALRYALTTAHSVLLPLYGDRAAIERTLAVGSELQLVMEEAVAVAETTDEPASVAPAAIEFAEEEELRRQTLAYLTGAVADALKISPARIDCGEPFREYGVDSFIVLKIINSLEQDFGTLPKTLLFEHADLEAVSDYFLANHKTALAERFVVEPGPDLAEPRTPLDSSPARAVRSPVIIPWRELSEHPDYDRLVAALLARYDSEASVSRGTRDIAPNLFFGSGRAAYFNTCHNHRTLLVYAYTGPADVFESLAAELVAWCQAQNLEPNFLGERRLEFLAGQTFSATPFGVCQRIPDLVSFNLEGKRMRRLRYMVARFQKAGACRTAEYRPGSDPATDIAISALVDAWCAGKTQVNPLVLRVKQEILAGSLEGEHRLFLTYLDERLQNAILITRLTSLNGYLMDLEFYPADMPLGGLEFAITEIMATLRGEDCACFSLGGTYGPEEDPSPNADPGIARIFAEMRARDDFGQGNFQFKNKFRTHNQVLYLCRPVGGDPETVSDVLLMIAAPDISEALPPPSAEPKSENQSVRASALAANGWNPMNLERVAYDFKTDSWAQLSLPVIAARLQELARRPTPSETPEQLLTEMLPFAHCHLFTSGRMAESFFCRNLQCKGKQVPQNLLFPTAIFHQIDNGYLPVEMPVATVFTAGSAELYRGDLDLTALATILRDNAVEVGFVWIELGNNAAGGYPVSVANLQRVKALLTPHGIPLVLDATRILENACFIGESEGGDPWTVAVELCRQADHLTASLAKDFCFDGGGVIATNDSGLSARIEADLARNEGGLRQARRTLLAAALADRAYIEDRVRQRMTAVGQLHAVLTAAGLPLLTPAGGHGVYLDTSRLPQLADYSWPLQSFLAWLYEHTGIRAGIHNAGMQKGTLLNGLVRFAVPTAMSMADVAEAGKRLATLCQQNPPVAKLELLQRPPGIGGEAMASFTREPDRSPPQTGPTLVPRMPAKTSEIAIVGLAGRYPNAPDLEQFWRNLIEGIDCISMAPPERPGYRPPVSLDGKPVPDWGGYLSDVDKFDALHFNISPREAEGMDPQERLFLETAWSALEDAGYTPETLVPAGESRNVGVYVGAVWSFYQVLGTEEVLKGNIQAPNSFHWSIANRVSYIMNLTGPSLTLDTACSSSLTAIHLACEAIRSGLCRAAIAGGVNLDLHPGKRLITAAGGTLSPDGRCYTFGSRANGYVAGEGVGAVVLKPLHKAERDGDHIYAIVKSTAVNHGGRTSGFVVPNPAAQGELVAAALDRAGIDARTVNYVEAHGTGTKLGDPVEIDGLTRAFRRRTEARQFCALGSVKTNIGHLEAAAGIAGITKLLLQLKHGKLVPSLHAEPANELIDFADSPFFVQRELANWLPVSLDGVVQPRRAGLSSFGAGGTNVHLIVEEYPVKPEPSALAGPALILLSARTAERLSAYVTRLLEAVSRQPEPALQNLAFTLRQGRRPLDFRLATVVDSVGDLRDRLGAYLEGREAGNLFSGKVTPARSKRATHGRSNQSGDLVAMARAWVVGDRNDLPLARNGARRISLPTYPFAKQRYWIDTVAVARAEGLHPLLDSRYETSAEAAFLKEFDPAQFIFRDHLVAGVPTLPGVGYLEMARAAANLALGRPVHRLKNHVWASPIDPACDPRIHTVLTEKGDSLHYEVFTEEPKNGRSVHAQGRLIPGELERGDRILDIAAIEARCGRQVEGAATYRRLAESGLTYGPELKAIAWSRHNQEEQLTRLELPASLVAEKERFLLHPAIMDGAVQAVVGLLDVGGDRLAYLPFVLGELIIRHPLPAVCYAHILRTASTVGAIKKFAITIADERGLVLVEMRDFSLKARDETNAEEPPWYYETFWQEKQPPSIPQKVAGSLLVLGREGVLVGSGPFAAETTVTVLVGKGFSELSARSFEIDPARAEDYTALVAALKRNDLLPTHVLHLGAQWSPAGHDALLSSGVWSLFYLLQALLKAGRGQGLRLLFAWHEDRDVPAFAAAAGLLRTIGLEHPGFSGKTLCVRGSWQDGFLWRELCSEGSEDVLIEEGIRKVSYVRALRVVPSDRTLVAKPGGVYLITGGAGGLGLLFAKKFAETAKAVVLVGRSPANPDLTGRMVHGQSGVAEVVYYQTDVTDREAVMGLVATIRSRFGRIDGVVHAAGLLRDALFLNKRASDMRVVLGAKISGTVHLDEATSKEPLDFFVLFSSLAAVTGNLGQCDYATANRFMDAFAQQRETLRANGERHGRTLAVNWPLWREGGMQVDEATEKMLARTTGMTPLETTAGLAALELGLAGSGSQLIVVDGDRNRIDRTLGLANTPPQPAKPVQAQATGAGGQRFMAGLTAGLTKILKLPAAEVDADAELGRFGFDSLTFTDFTNHINETFDVDLTPVIFFEYETLAALAGHLAEICTPPAQISEERLTVDSAPASYAAAPDPEEPFAIVGMSAVLPGSPDLETFWAHLLAADDLISEIPADRWDWRALYGDPLMETDKTDIKWGGFMPEIDKFDAAFFGISPREAVLMDPQQRIFLETVWKTIEDAGYGPGQLAGSNTGLFVGSGGIDYHDLLIRNGIEVGAHSATGMMHSVLANRVSYLLNLRGPSEPVETACSSSLVALHRAMAAIQRGDCDQAIVGGINLIASPDLYIGLAKASMLCSDGRCKTFDEAANGYVRGEGIGALFIKPLSRARADPAIELQIVADLVRGRLAHTEDVGQRDL